jgi:tRNA pseudouridine-54 N-methylase
MSQTSMPSTIVRFVLRLTWQRPERDLGEGQELSRSLPGFSVRPDHATLLLQELAEAINFFLRETGGDVGVGAGGRPSARARCT